MKNKFTLFVSVLYVMIMCSCGSIEGDDLLFEYADSLNITNALSIFKAGDNLYKITEDDTVEELVLLDDRGQVLNWSDNSSGKVSLHYFVKEIQSLNDVYLSVIFSNASYDDSIFDWGYFFVNKQTGKVYLPLQNKKTTGIDRTVSNGLFLNTKTFSLDGSLVYFICQPEDPYSHKTDIRYIDLSSIEDSGISVVSRGINSASSSYRSFVLGADNDFLISYLLYDTSMSNPFVLSYQKDGTESSNIQGYEGDAPFWVAADGNMYMCNSISCTEVFYIDTSSYVFLTSIGTFSEEMNRSNCYFYNFNNKTIALDLTNMRVFELYNSGTGLASMSGISGFRSLSAVARSGEYYYLAGIDTDAKEIVSKCDVSNHVCSVLESQFGKGVYSIRKMIFNSFGRMFFNALRKSDNINVIGIWDGGTPVIIDDELNLNVEQFEAF